jgi:hypothetical protein
MLRYVPIALAFALIITTGVVHGIWTDRWSVSRELQMAAKRLETIPLDVGEWKGQPEELDRRQQEAAGIIDYISRRYENRRDGTKISILLAVGRPGPIASHKPEICYAGAGFESLGDRVPVSVSLGSGSRPAEFAQVQFRKEHTAIPLYLRVLYSLSSRGNWVVPSGDARVAFAWAPALFKLYVVRQTPSPDASMKEEPAVDFLRQFLPEVDRALFPAPASTAHS